MADTQILQIPVKHKTTSEQRDEIARRYATGENTVTLGKIFNRSSTHINRLCRERGVKMRSNSEAQRKLPLNENAFSKITPESAYWIGFLMADGCIKNGHHIALKIAAQDAEHIEKFKNFVGSGHKIHVQKRGPWGGYPRQNLHGIVFNSYKMTEDLAKYGIGPRKSFTAKVIGLENNRDFWRGMVDGDGCIFTYQLAGKEYPRVGLVGGKEICKQFLDFVRSYTETRTKPQPMGSIFQAALGGKAAKAILGVLYRNSVVSLNRKAEKAHDVLQRF